MLELIIIIIMVVFSVNRKRFGDIHVTVIITIRKILSHKSRKCYHHGRGRFLVHRDQFLTDSDIRGLDPRLRHRISSFARVTSGIRRQKSV